jgi:hypothetical protein
MSITYTGLSEFPTFDFGYVTSIQKEVNRNADGTPLYEKHSISVRAAIVGSGASPEARYEDLIQQAASLADLAGSSGSAGKEQYYLGTLTLDGSVVYNSARLLSISIGEPPEDTAASQFIEVNMSFEAYANGDLTTYKIQSSSESVEVRREDSQLTFEDSNIESDTKNFNYTIVHTISAQGYVTEGVDAHTHAKSWVEARKKDTSKGLVLIYNAYDKLVSADEFSPETDMNMGDINGILDEYNIVRTSSIDPVNGSYSLTTTFTRSKDKASIEIEAAYQKSESADESISVRGTVQGYMTEGPESLTEGSKIVNARDVFNAISGNGKFTYNCKAFNVANTVWGRYNTEAVGFDTTDLYAVGVSVGENKVNGSISFNATYPLYPNGVISLRNALSSLDCITANLSITDENMKGKGFDIDTVAIIPIIGRGAVGPVFQNMSTTRERKRSVQLEATFKASQRTPDNDALRTICVNKAKEYAPSSALEVFNSSFNCSWDFANGRMSVSLEWTYR